MDLLPCKHARLPIRFSPKKSLIVGEESVKSNDIDTKKKGGQ